MKKIIITGAAGLVGINLIKNLPKNKYEIIAIDKNQSRLDLAKKINPDIKTVNADLSSRGDWEKFFKNVQGVIQLQAQISDTKKEPYVKNNIESVKNVVESCEKYKVKKIIHVSSSVVISVADDNYTNTKKKGEEIVKKCKVPYIILRPPLMYGPFNTKHLSYIVEKFEKSPVVLMPGNGKYIRQPLYVKDFIKIIINCIEKKPENKIYDIIGKEKIYFIDLLKIIFQEKNKKKIFLRVPIPIFLIILKLYEIITGKNPFIPDQLKSLMAGDFFPVKDWEKEFDIKYTPFREGIKDMIKDEK